MGKLHYILDPAIKGLLYTKIMEIQRNGLDFSFEVTEDIEEAPIDSVVLGRILGVIIDNAIEAAVDSEQHRIRIAIYTKQSDITYFVSNSTKPIEVSLGKLIESGYSSKNNHLGIGLASVDRMIAKLDNVYLNTEYENGEFCQILEIERKIGGSDSVIK